MDKKRHKYEKVLKIFRQKTSFHNLQKVPKNKFSNTMAIGLFINFAQNFKHVQNKNLNLYTRHMEFTDQNCVISRSEKIAKKST